MHAPIEQLQTATAGDLGVCDRLIAARELMEIAAREQLVGSPVDPADPRLLRYLRHLIGTASDEKLYVIFLDGRDRYIRDECVAEGHTTRITTSLRPILRRAFELGARGLILAHNHPSGSVHPSPADIRTTRRILRLTEAIEIRVLDHLIVSADEAYSMRLSGHL